MTNVNFTYFPSLYSRRPEPLKEPRIFSVAMRWIGLVARLFRDLLTLPFRYYQFRAHANLVKKTIAEKDKSLLTTLLPELSFTTLSSLVEDESLREIVAPRYLRELPQNRPTSVTSAIQAIENIISCPDFPKEPIVQILLQYMEIIPTLYQDYAEEILPIIEEREDFLMALLNTLTPTEVAEFLKKPATQSLAAQKLIKDEAFDLIISFLEKNAHEPLYTEETSVYSFIKSNLEKLPLELKERFFKMELEKELSLEYLAEILRASETNFQKAVAKIPKPADDTLRPSTIAYLLELIVELKTQNKSSKTVPLEELLSSFVSSEIIPKLPGTNLLYLYLFTGIFHYLTPSDFRQYTGEQYNDKCEPFLKIIYFTIDKMPTESAENKKATDFLLKNIDVLSKTPEEELLIYFLSHKLNITAETLSKRWGKSSDETREKLFEILTKAVETPVESDPSKKATTILETALPILCPDLHAS